MDDRRSGEDRRINGSPVCDCGKPKDVRSHTCRACAVARGDYLKATHSASRASIEARLRLRMIAAGWTDAQLRIWLSGWRAGRHAASSDATRKKT